MAMASIAICIILYDVSLPEGITKYHDVSVMSAPRHGRHATAHRGITQIAQQLSGAHGPTTGACGTDLQWIFPISMAIPGTDWLEVPTIYKAYVRPM